MHLEAFQCNSSKDVLMPVNLATIRLNKQGKSMREITNNHEFPNLLFGTCS